MNKKIAIGIVVIIVCILLTFGATYYFVGMQENIEISDMKANYESDIDNLNAQITAFQNLAINSEINHHKYVKQMDKGFEEYYEAGLNVGIATAHYEIASEEYTDGFFLLASIDASYSDTYYSYASASYRDAKAFFDLAIDFAISDKTMQLAQLYYNLTDIDAQVTDEMHQACEYLTSACDYYYDDNYDMGGGEIDKMNEHIVAHDALVPTQNDLLSEINALLDNFY